MPLVSMLALLYESNPLHRFKFHKIHSGLPEKIFIIIVNVKTQIIFYTCMSKCIHKQTRLTTEPEI